MVRGQQDSDLFHYSFEKSLVAVYHIIYNVSVADCFEVFPCAVNLGFFNQSKLHGGHRAFCLSNKIYVLDCTLIKSNSPVRIIVSNSEAKSRSFVESYTIWSYKCRCAFIAFVPSLPLIVGAVKISVS